MTGGTSVLNVVAVSPSGGTAHVKRTVVFDFVPGTLLLDVTDPERRRQRPGQLRVPDLRQLPRRARSTSSGSRSTTRAPTSPSGSRRATCRRRSAARSARSSWTCTCTFPARTTTSTAAAHPLRNFTIAPAFAWSRLIQVQGFGQRYIDAHDPPNTLGTATITGNAVSRFITFRVSKASLGTPGPGWGFTVVLTGQDGFSQDQARGFQPTPQDFQFGVCAVTTADPHCTANPATVPKAVDVIAAPGVSQSVELDYTLGPVVLTGVVDSLGRAGELLHLRRVAARRPRRCWRARAGRGTTGPPRRWPRLRPTPSAPAPAARDRTRTRAPTAAGRAS